jgi:16S rRNA (guanine1207-N2)-methyltransferase
MLANELADRVRVLRVPGLEGIPDGSLDLVVLNPPFHLDGAVDASLAPSLFAEAARALRDGGELWTVFNSSLGYRQVMERLVGPTRQITRNSKFTVTASIRRSTAGKE